MILIYDTFYIIPDFIFCVCDLVYFISHPSTSWFEVESLRNLHEVVLQKLEEAIMLYNTHAIFRLGEAFRESKIVIKTKYCFNDFHDLISRRGLRTMPGLKESNSCREYIQERRRRRWEGCVGWGNILVDLSMLRILAAHSLLYSSVVTSALIFFNFFLSYKLG